MNTYPYALMVGTREHLRGRALVGHGEVRGQRHRPSHGSRFDVLVQRRRQLEGGVVVDFNHKRVRSLVQHDVEPDDLKAPDARTPRTVPLANNAHRATSWTAATQANNFAV